MLWLDPARNNLPTYTIFLKRSFVTTVLVCRNPPKFRRRLKPGEIAEGIDE